VTLCGEMAARPLECLALVGLGYRSLSVSPVSVGPIKALIRSTSAARVGALIDDLMARGEVNVRAALKAFADAERLEL
jgi:phosphotransferase system, enzyme I, PtsP